MNAIPMNIIKQWMYSPQQRRQAMTAGSGVLIVAGLAAGRMADLPNWHNGLMLAAALIAGWDITLRAWRSLWNRHISIELLVTIAAAGALLIGEYWEAAAVTFLFMLGAYLEARTMSHTRNALQELLEVAPVVALVQRNGRQEEVAPHFVTPGEIVVVKPGMKIPVDGEVEQGHSTVDESSITGESMPVTKSRETQVFAGTINQEGLLHVRATGVGADTTLARIIRRVEEAQEEKAPAQRFIERFGQWYTPAIIALSGIVFLFTWNVELALTLLVIGCPGALIISTPVSVVAGIGSAARQGILIKGGEYLENAGKVTALALDKTGTLTIGKPRLAEITILQPEAKLAEKAQANQSLTMSTTQSDRWNSRQQKILHWAAIAESGSEHPLARPIVNAAQETAPVPQADEFTMHIGRGIEARYQNHAIAVGNETLMAQQAIDLPDAAASELARLKAAGHTAVLVALDGSILGVLAVSDPLRENAPELVRQLKSLGIQEILMLTGDDPRTAQSIARQAGIQTVRAGLLPEEKLAAIHELQQAGHIVAMVGDGINDAPALAAADIGIAMGAAGAGVAIETADIALMSSNLLKIPEAFRLSRATGGNIRQNVAIALVTVAILLSGVLMGSVHMAGGMFIHELSVLVVILNGMRLLRGNGRNQQPDAGRAPWRFRRFLPECPVCT